METHREVVFIDESDWLSENQCGMETLWEHFDTPPLFFS